MPDALITSDPGVMLGKPVVAGTRITVEMILRKLGAGEGIDQLLDAHPRLTREAVLAALAFAASTLPLTRLLVLIVALAVGGTALGQAPPPAGQNVFICGHSFHVPTADPLSEIAATAGIKDHKLVGKQIIGGSRVIQHWTQPDDKDKVRKAVRAGGLDVLTLASHIQIPDEGIDKFADLLVEHDPKARLLVQASWPAFDMMTLTGRPEKFTNADRDATDLVALRAAYDTYLVKLRDQLAAVNRRHREKLGRDVAFVIPAGHAVLALREKVKKGEADGVAKQADLFRDPIGHGKEPVIYIAAYCVYATIYCRSPVGLPAPAGLTKAGASAKFVRQLQETAWDAVTHEPMSGVK